MIKIASNKRVMLMITPRWNFVNNLITALQRDKGLYKNETIPNLVIIYP